MKGLTADAVNSEQTCQPWQSGASDDFFTIPRVFSCKQPESTEAKLFESNTLSSVVSKTASVVSKAANQTSLVHLLAAAKTQSKFKFNATRLNSIHN